MSLPKNFFRYAAAVALAAPFALLVLPNIIDFARGGDRSVGGIEFGVFVTVVVAAVVSYIATRKHNPAYRFAVGLAMASALILAWMNGAVGLIGAEENPANLIYYLVLSIGSIGAIIARFEPYGMARALLATAVAQALVAIGVAVIALTDGSPIHFAAGHLMLNGFFAGLFLGSALLFHYATRETLPAHTITER